MKKFVIEPSNGWWGISEEGFEEDLLKEIRKNKLPLKKYNGVYSVILNTTNKCNLGWVYCSAAQNRSEKSMPIEIAKRAVDEAIKLELQPRIVFHGSEPLLNMNLIRSVVKYGESLDRKVLFYIQTNLTKLDDDNLNFIKENNIGLSTSIDGFKSHHDITRPFRNGSSSYDKVIENIEKVLEFQDGICTATVITKHNVNSLSEIALDLEKKGITHIQFLPVVKCSDGKEDFRPSNKDLTRGYIDLFEQTFRRMEHGEQTAIIRNIPQFFSCLFLRTGVDNCRICSSVDYHPILAVDIDGSIYPCDYFFGDKKYSMGNIQNSSFLDVLNSPKNLRCNFIEDSACKECDLKHVCGGGCMADKIFSGNEKPYYCQTYLEIFRYLGNKLPELKEKGLIGKVMQH
jgi:radical SAM protein with 4Fe4S-binding SPASM domain